MRKLYKAFAIVTLISVITRLLSFVFKIYLSRELGAEILGLYQICMSVFMLFACICCSGLPVTLSRITAESDAVSDKKSQFGSVSTCLFTGVFISILLISAILTFPQLLDFIFSDKRCKKIFLIMLPMLLTTSIYAILRGWFWGKKYFMAFSMTEFFDEIFKVMFAIILLEGSILAISKEYAYALAMLLGDIVIICIIIFLYIKKKGKLYSPSNLKTIAKSATPLTITRIFGSLIVTFISLILPSLLVSQYGLSTSQATAEFGRASGMVMPLIFTPTSIIGSLGVVLIPEIASANADKNVGSLTKSIGNSILFSCFIACFFFSFFASAGNQIGTLLYNDSLSGQYLAFASIIMIPMCINGIVVSMLNSMGKELNTFISHIAGCIILIILILLLPKYMGIKTYFLALGTFHTISLVINTIMLNHYVKIDITTGLRCCVCIIYALICMLFTKTIINYLNNQSLILQIAVSGILLSIAYLPVALATKILKLNKKPIFKHRLTFL